MRVSVWWRVIPVGWSVASCQFLTLIVLLYCYRRAGDWVTTENGFFGKRPCAGDRNLHSSHDQTSPVPPNNCYNYRMNEMLTFLPLHSLHARINVLICFESLWLFLTHWINDCEEHSKLKTPKNLLKIKILSNYILILFIPLLYLLFNSHFKKIFTIISICKIKKWN